jgi:serine/threonine protein kinase
MENLDATAVGQQALRLRLITEEQLAEVRDELGNQAADVFELLRALERKGYLTPYMSQKLLKGDTDGYFLGGYRVLYKIASGSFGRVFRADDPRTGTVVAVKILRRRWSEDQHSIDLFEREGKVGMSLRHPNIVEILAVSRDTLSKAYYIVMEFVEGGNLRDFLGIRKRLEPAEALRILEDATSALAYAYSKGVTHRDMKLTNILISSQGTAKLVDFGLAGIFSSLGMKDLQSEGKMDRTVDYAGLEKTTGAPHGDVRSDIYFLGAVLYEMLTGRPPLAMTKDPRSRMLKARFENVQPISRKEVEAPPVVFHLVETMMALDPRHRYQTPTQLLDAVREARREVESRGTGGVAARPPTRTVFVVEEKERLQDVMREKFKEYGYKVLLSSDPTRALARFRQQPFDALVVDIGTAGEEGLLIGDQILTEAERKDLPCAAIFLFSKEQADWKDRVKPRPRTAVLTQPVTLKQLHHTLRELVPLKGGE